MINMVKKIFVVLLSAAMALSAHAVTMLSDSTDCSNVRAIPRILDTLKLKEFDELDMAIPVAAGGNVVGSPSVSLNVGSTGASICSFDVEIPNGGSFMPHVGLEYNSQIFDYGLAGYGVNITGLSAITRTGKDVFHDGEVRGLTYSDKDNFLLDGKRLVLQGVTDEGEEPVYTVEGNPYTKVICHKNTSDDFWFEVVTNDGVVSQYGNTSESRLSYKNKKGQTHTAIWYINRSEDRYSNYITYDYFFSDMYVYPSSVVYGTNGKKDRGVQSEIDFIYENLTGEPKLFAVEDQRGKLNKRLCSIVTKTNGLVYREYSLCYDDNLDKSWNRFSRLVKIVESNGKGEKLNPVVLNWKGLPAPSLGSSLLAVTSDESNRFVEENDATKIFMALDMNGDGVSDNVRISSVYVLENNKRNYFTHVYVYLSVVSEDGEVSYAENPLCYRLPASYAENALGNVQMFDYDGDGYKDFAIPYYSDVHGEKQVRWFLLLGKDISQSNTSNVRVFATPISYANKLPLIASLDCDGKGKGYIMYVEQAKGNGVYSGIIIGIDGDEKRCLRNVSFDLPANPGKLFAADYNNDGLTDIIFLYKGGYKIYFSNGGSSLTDLFTETNVKVGNDFGDNWRVRQGDFNGDGLVDFVYYQRDVPRLQIAFNNGDGTFSFAKTEEIGLNKKNTDKENDKFSVNVCDFDGDGRSDVLVVKSHYTYHGGLKGSYYSYDHTQVRWLYSDGTTLKVVKSLDKNRQNDAMEGHVFVGDFDGDGKYEVANYGSRLDINNDSFDEEIHVYKFGSTDAASGKVTSVTDGYGKVTKVTYAYATDPKVYKRTEENCYPINTYTIPLSLVSSLSVGNGAAGKVVTDYAYENMKVHVAGRGMLGFSSVTKNNVTAKTTDRTSIKKWNDKWWIPEEVKTENRVGDAVSSSLSKFTIADVDSNYYAYVSRSEAVDLDGNETVTETKFDLGKGVVTESCIKNDGDNMYKNTRYSLFVKKAGMWLPEMVTLTQKHKDDATPYTARTAYLYDDLGNITSERQFLGTTMCLTTTKKYDDYGNVISSVSKGSNVKPITHLYDYDASGRFVVKQYQMPAAAVSTFTYDVWGNVLTENDVTNPNDVLTVRHEYDNWGNRIATYEADGSKTHYSKSWGRSDMYKYCLRITPSNSPEVTKWYDNAGHEVYSISNGVKHVSIRKETEYNALGRVSTVKEKVGKLRKNETYSYDERGRVVEYVSSTGKDVTYTYGKNTVTTVDAGKQYVKTMDAWGNVAVNKDPMCTVTYMYGSNGKPVKVETEGAAVTMTYDVAGNKTSLTDPDAGTMKYTYAADGTLLTETDGRGIKTINTYDELGRLSKITIGGRAITNTYGTSGNEMFRLTKTTLSGETDSKIGVKSVEYVHDRYGNVVMEKRVVGNKGEYVMAYEYNDKNQLCKKTYPNGLEVTCEYDKDGFVTKTLFDGNTVSELTSYNGLVTKRSFMGQLVSVDSCDEKGYETARKVMCGDLCLDCVEMGYDYSTGNIIQRKRNGQGLETFVYDDLDRLISIRRKLTGIPSNRVKRYALTNMEYSANGNIEFKTGIGNYDYESEKPHAVTSVDETGWSKALKMMSTPYNVYGKIKSVHDSASGNELWFEYGTDLQRWYSELKNSGEVLRSTVYFDDYERVEDEDAVYEFCYVDDDVVIVKYEDTVKPCLMFTDVQGSVLSIFDDNNEKVFHAYYDAWGKQTVVVNTIGYNRGYTGHEMMPEFGLINMNGRVYDPNLGRFLSPDNYVQMPDNSQNFNRYSYCLNNPLKYNDPSGEFFGVSTFLNFFKDLFVNTLIRPWTEGINAWTNGDNWHSTTMGFKMDVGLFKGSFSQVVSRFTWELPQTALGYHAGAYASALNMVKDVSYFDGATSIEYYQRNWGALTLGSFIHGSRGITADPNNTLFQHEYGHYLQSQKYGLFYMQRFAIPSFVDAWTGRGEHINHAVEQDANIRAFKYFKEKYGDEYGVTMNDEGDGWKMNVNRIVGYDSSLPYDHPTNQDALSNTLGLSWSDYVFLPFTITSSTINCFSLHQ